MARCPYCNEEYTAGELYCKQCFADLSGVDVQPTVPVLPAEDSLDAFGPASPPQPPKAAEPVTGTEVDGNAADIPDVPLAPEVAPESVKEVSAEPSRGEEHVSLPAPPPGPPIMVDSSDGGDQKSPASAEVGDAMSPEARSDKTLSVGPLCQKCGASNEKDARFCDGCGSPLSGVCPKCQKSVRPGAKFCQHCAANLLAPNATTVEPITPVPLPPSSGVFCLVIFGRNGMEAARFALKDGVNQIGAKSPGEGIIPEVDLASVDSEKVISRRHAILRVGTGGLTLADCDSTNGTRVNGIRITTGSVVVDDRSDILFGNLFARIVRV